MKGEVLYKDVVQGGGNWRLLAFAHRRPWPRTPWLHLHRQIVTTALYSQNRYALMLLFTSGGANAVKETGHFEVRKSSSQVTRSQGHGHGCSLGMHIFPHKKLTTFSTPALIYLYLLYVICVHDCTLQLCIVFGKNYYIYKFK